MAATVVQAVAGRSSASGPYALAINGVAAGSSVVAVAVVQAASGTGLPQAVTSAPAGTWVRDAATGPFGTGGSGTDAQALSVWRRAGVEAGTHTVTVAPAAGVGFSRVAVVLLEVAGLDPAAPVRTAGATSTDNPLSFPAVSTAGAAAAGDLLIAGLTAGDPWWNWTVGSGWTEVGGNAGPTAGYEVARSVAAGAAVQTASWSIEDPSPAAAAIVAYAPAPSSPPVSAGGATLARTAALAATGSGTGVRAAAPAGAVQAPAAGLAAVGAASVSASPAAGGAVLARSASLSPPGQPAGGTGAGGAGLVAGTASVAAGSAAGVRQAAAAGAAQAAAAALLAGDFAGSVAATGASGGGALLAAGGVDPGVTLEGPGGLDLGGGVPLDLEAPAQTGGVALLPGGPVLALPVGSVLPGALFGVAALLAPAGFAQFAAGDAPPARVVEEPAPPPPATGSPADMARRLAAVLPPWFSPAGTVPPVLAAPVAMAGSVGAWLFGFVAAVRRQTRLGTTEGGWLDLFALDFFGPRRVRRRRGQTDEAYRRRIRAELFRPRVTREAMRAALLDLTGREPRIFEPGRPADTGGIGVPGGLAWGVSGAIGSLALPGQVFIDVYRDPDQGIPFAAGIGTPAGGIGVPSRLVWGSLAQIAGQLTDDDVLATIEATRPEGVVVWVRLHA